MMKNESKKLAPLPTTREKSGMKPWKKFGGVSVIHTDLFF